MNWETLLSFGDSITIGSRTYLGYPEYASELLRQATQTEWNTFNYAKAGITTVELHRMMSADFAHLKQLSPELITVLVGTNDAKKGISSANFAIAYRQVILKARLIAPEATLLVFSIPPLQKGVKLPYTRAMNAVIEEYNDIIKTIGESFRVPVVELELSDKHFGDGVHLNEAGIAKMGQQIADYILKLRGIEPI